MKRGTRRLGQRAAERRAAGGKRAVGRDSASVEEWTARVRTVYALARGRCERPTCRRSMVDVHHVVKRSQGGSDALDNLVGLCRRCHDQTDAAWVDGRLVIERLPAADGEAAGARFAFLVLYQSPAWGRQS